MLGELDGDGFEEGRSTRVAPPVRAAYTPATKFQSQGARIKNLKLVAWMAGWMIGIVVIAWTIVGLTGWGAFSQTSFQYTPPSNVVPGETYTITVTPVAPPPPPPPAPPPAGSLWFAESGSDSNPCTRLLPCQTLAKANLAQLSPGNTLSFHGGDTFLGHLDITPTQVPGGGNAATPIVITSYDTGTAIIASSQDGVNANQLGPKNYAILIDSVSGVTVKGLSLTANGHYVQYGVIVQNTANTGTVSGITIQGNDVGGFTTQAPVVYGEDGGNIYLAGFSEVGTRGVCGGIDVQVLDNKVHGNDGVGSLVTQGINAKGCGNIHAVVRGNEVWNIGGRSDVPLSGNGILLASAGPSSLIEHNHVHHNMWNATGCGGPMGLWTFRTDSAMVQFNEVDHMHANAPGACDVGAFDADGAVTNTIIQYNYSHDNDGPAVLLYSSEAPWGGNVVRYNISVNDNQTANDGGGVFALNFDAGPAQIYNNTIVITSSAAQYGTQGFSFGYGHVYPAGTVISNNIVYATIANQYGGWWAINDDNSANDYSNIVMNNNLYWNPTTGGEGFGIGGFDSTFAQWQATGHDQGSTVQDPKLVNPTGSDAITWNPPAHTGPQPGPTIYKPQAGSPAHGAGIAQPNNGGRDYFGTAITAPPSIGAAQ